jgi:hypothetical protein
MHQPQQVAARRTVARRFRSAVRANRPLRAALHRRVLSERCLRRGLPSAGPLLPRNGFPSTEYVNGTRRIDGQSHASIEIEGIIVANTGGRSAEVADEAVVTPDAAWRRQISDRPGPPASRSMARTRHTASRANLSPAIRRKPEMVSGNNSPRAVSNHPRTYIWQCHSDPTAASTPILTSPP